MKRMTTAFVVVSLVAAMMAFPIPALAWGRGVQSFHHFNHFHHFGHFHHFSHFHGHGCCFGGGFAVGVFTGVALGSAFAPFYAYPPPVFVAAPPVYAPPPPPAFWYFCRSAGAYYPHVPACPEPWVPVPAR